MSRPSKQRQQHRRPSVHKMNRRQADHRFSRQTQRFNFEPPVLSALPDQAALATQEVTQTIATHDIHSQGPETPPQGRMTLRHLVVSPHFQAGLNLGHPQLVRQA